MVAPIRAAAPTLASIREKLRKDQEELQHKIDATKVSQKEYEAQQKQGQADLTAIERIATAQQAATADADTAIKAADKTIANLRPKVEATLDDDVETKLKQAFQDLNNDGAAAQQKVGDAREELSKRQRDQVNVQQATGAQAEVVQQQLAALTALPARKASLTKDFTRQQAELQGAYDSGNVRKAYILLLELSATRDELERLQQPAYEEGLVQAHTAATTDWGAKRADLEKKDQAVAEQQSALGQAVGEQKTFESGRAARLQKIWND